MNLKGLNAVIVGGGDGIGRGSALALAARGVNLLIADLRLARPVAAGPSGAIHRGQVGRVRRAGRHPRRRALRNVALTSSG